jgi:hypothetical protein
MQSRGTSAHSGGLIYKHVTEQSLVSHLLLEVKEVLEDEAA